MHTLKIVKGRKHLGKRNFRKPSLPLRLMRPSDTSIYPQFLMSVCQLTISNEWILEMFPAERLLELFGQSMSLGCPHRRRRVPLISVNGIFDSKLSSTMHYGVTRDGEVWAEPCSSLCDPAYPTRRPMYDGIHFVYTVHPRFRTSPVGESSC